VDPTSETLVQAELACIGFPITAADWGVDEHVDLFLAAQAGSVTVYDLKLL
jgi:hypothetical protein